MAGINVTVAHKLEPAEAVSRIKNILGEMKAQYAGKISNLNEEWNGNIGKFNFSFTGFTVSGTLTVTPEAVNIAGPLPAVAIFFKKEIESKLRDRAETLLA